MLNKLRNRFLMLMMVTVTLLVLLFFVFIATFAYSSAESRSDALLDRGFNTDNLENRTDNPDGSDKFSHTFSIDLDNNGNIITINSSFTMETTFYISVSESARSKLKPAGTVLFGSTTLKYKTFPTDFGKRVVFVDVSKDI